MKKYFDYYKILNSRFFSPKIINFILAFLFSYTFYRCYVEFLYTYFEYAGFPYYEKSNIFLMLTLLMCSLPVFFFNGIKYISSFISVFIFIILYIPTIITFSLGLNFGYFKIFCYEFVFFTSMILFFISDRINIKSTYLKRFKIIKFQHILYVNILITIWMLFIYRSNLRFVSFDDVYLQRFSNADLGNDIFSRYMFSWLINLFIPLVLLYGIVMKKKTYLIIGSFSCVCVYMSIAAKGTILMPIILWGMYFLLKKFSFKNIYFSMITVLTVILSLLLIFTNKDSTILFFISSLLMWRVIGTGGNLNLAYFEFFETHPKTYYSHISPVNFITNMYPYNDLGLGKVVGQYFWAEDMNANANFWATDGIAAIGISGVLIISLFFTIILIYINKVTYHYDLDYLILVFIPFMFSLLNTSLFSTILSGGGFLIIVVLKFLKSDEFIKVD